MRKLRRFLTKNQVPYVGPVSLWIFLFVFAPLGVMLYLSFMTIGPRGEITGIFSPENYLALGQINYAVVFLRTALLAAGATIVCLLIGYPIAYWIVKYGGRWKPVLVFLIILPSWTCYIIRVYALQTLAANNGLINSALLGLNLISDPITLLYNQGAVIVGLINIWIPFMILPIYASLEGLNFSLLEASEDLGATPLRKFLTVTLPLTKGGVYAGIILTFIPSLGAWFVPLVLGGAKVWMAGNLIEHYFIRVGNIPLGAAIAVALTAIVLLLIFLFIKLGGEEAVERIV